MNIFISKSLATLAFSIAVCIPSLKFYFFSSILNLLPSLMLLLALFFSDLRRKPSFFIYLSSFILFLVVFFLPSISVLDWKIFLRILGFFLFAILSIVAIKLVNQRIFYCFSSCFLGITCLGYYFGLIKVSGAGELSYIVLASQLGFLAFFLFFLLFQFARGRLLCIFAFGFVLSVLLDLSARSALVGLLVSIISYCYFARYMYRFILVVLVIIAFIFFMGIEYNDLFTEYLIKKTFMLLDGNDERLHIYATYIDAIIQNPLGYGWGGYTKFASIYPHNLLIELFSAIGLLAFFFFIALGYLLYQRARECAAADIMISLNFSTFVFFAIIWSFSFDLFSAYPFVVALLLVLYGDSNGTFCERNNYNP